MEAEKSLALLGSEACKELFVRLYGRENKAGQRYENLIRGFLREFGGGDILLFSSPGRTELCGNHTDHNHGKILGASIDLDCIAAAAKNGTNRIRIISEGYRSFSIDLEHLESSAEKSGVVELVKGLADGFIQRGFLLGGFDAYISSNVIPSAGVSSSAAFETLLCQIINTLFNEGRIEKLSYAHIGRHAENVYWNKASGLLDQMCCAVGGMITIDFKNPESPKVRRLDFDFADSGYDLIIVQTGRGHADLSEDYSAIPNEMKSVAKFFGKEVLAETDKATLLASLTQVRRETGDRAVMRALHFFDENERVDKAVAALNEGDFASFLKNIKDSGNSSWKYLQNCYTNSACEEQGISISLALTEDFLAKKGCGACRVHGGGFAGVIMAMLPREASEEYIAYIEGHTGKGNAYKMSIRPYGSICLNHLL